MQRRVVLRVLTVLLLAAGLLSAGACRWSSPAAQAASAPASQPAGPKRLRVLCYNIHHGRGMDNRIDLERIARVIREAGADLAALQEVDQNTRRCGKVDQPAELARLTGLHASFGKAMDFDGGAYGLAVLSRWPAEQAQTYALPGKAGREPRALLKLRLAAAPGRPALTFFCTHLDHQLQDERQKQVERIVELTGEEEKDPRRAGRVFLLAGDFNDTPRSRPIRTLLELWTDTAPPDAPPTCPADKPQSKIDYIFFRPAGAFRPAGFTVIDEPKASDHRPIAAELELR